MKMLVHKDTPDTLPVGLDALKAHLRIAGDEENDAVQVIGMTAAAEIEHFAQIALITQTIRATIFDPPEMVGLTLPIGPVADAHVPTVTADGDAFTDFDFEPGLRPYIAWHSAFHKLTPKRLVVSYTAGFGAGAADVPHDLAQAVMDQAALHYDGRSPMDAKALTTSPHMARIGARYRGVRM